MDHLSYVSKKTTIQYYDDHADVFVKDTITAEMSEARQRFLMQVPKGACILDFGCGSGRDTKAFLNAGYSVEATDGSAQLCRKAAEYTGIPVKQMLFQELEAKATFMMMVKGNLKILLQRPAIFLGVCAVLFLVARIVFFGDRLRPDARVAAGILAVSLYPFAWYLVTKNHSYIHAPFTYRELSIFVYGLCAALAAVVVPGKGRAFRQKNADRKTEPENRAMHP